MKTKPQKPRIKSIRFIHHLFVMLPLYLLLLTLLSLLAIDIEDIQNIHLVRLALALLPLFAMAHLMRGSLFAFGPWPTPPGSSRRNPPSTDMRNAIAADGDDAAKATYLPYAAELLHTMGIDSPDRLQKRIAFVRDLLDEVVALSDTIIATNPDISS